MKYHCYVSLCECLLLLDDDCTRLLLCEEKSESTGPEMREI